MYKSVRYKINNENEIYKLALYRLTSLSKEENRMKQMNLFDNNNINEENQFPQTRYQGSKMKIIDWITSSLEELDYHSVLDLFGGTGSFSYAMKKKGKTVFYNDILKFNSIIGKALIENSNIKLTESDLSYILTKPINYPKFIQKNFGGIFYYDEENDWLDYVSFNIRNMKCEIKQAIAYFALFQSCISKRPYNLFHRANLNVRSNNVKRSFGNKTTWDKSFESHFTKNVKEANESIFDNRNKCFSFCYPALEFPVNRYKPDLVYMDPPYINSKGIGTDYLDFYSFLEGLVDYDNWGNRINQKYKHKTLVGKGENPWNKKREILFEFQKTIEKYSDSIIVISYRDDGIPSKEQIIELLKKYKDNVIDTEKDYQYVLSKSVSKEMLLIAY